MEPRGATIQPSDRPEHSATLSRDGTDEIRSEDEPRSRSTPGLVEAMTRSPDRPPGEAGCGVADCRRSASFWIYEPDAGEWSPVCQPHAEQRHPSLEIHAWLESGYMKPIELGEPTAPPQAPRGRSAAFRELVEEAMGW